MVEILDTGIERLVEQARSIMGLTSTPRTEWSSNQSPRESVFTFIQSMDDYRYSGIDTREKVSLTLPSDYKIDSTETKALKAIFNRIGAIHPTDLPSQDAKLLDTLQRFEVFPYAIDHEWMWARLESPPTGRIVLVSQEDGSWRFSETTLREAPQLLKSIQSIPPKFSNVYGDDSRRMFMPSFEGSPWWSWLVALAGLVAAYFVGQQTRRGLIRWGDRYEARTKPLIGSMFRSISTSIAIVLGTIVFVIASIFIDLSPTVSDLYWRCIQVVLLLAVVWVLFGLTDLVATVVRSHVVDDQSEYSEMTVTIIQRTVHTFLFIMVAIFILENVFGFSIGALLTGLGILGLALSLAGKETAQNLFGAISIFVNRPFVVGDWVEYKDEIGEVKDVRMQATHILLLSGEILIVPNMQFISNEVENLAMRKYLRREMNIAIPYASDPEKVDEAIDCIDDILRSNEIVEAGKCDLEERPPIISFSDFGDYYLNLKVYYWYFIGDKGETLQRNSERGWFSYLEHCTLVNRAILKAFNGQDIKFAFPTQTVALGKADGGTT